MSLHGIKGLKISSKMEATFPVYLAVELLFMMTSLASIQVKKEANKFMLMWKTRSEQWRCYFIRSQLWQVVLLFFQRPMEGQSWEFETFTITFEYQIIHLFFYLDMKLCYTRVIYWDVILLIANFRRLLEQPNVSMIFTALWMVTRKRIETFQDYGWCYPINYGC